MTTATPDEFASQMRVPTHVLLFSIIALLPVLAQADKLVTQLRVSVDTFAIRKIDANTPTRVAFLGTSIRAEVSLTAALLPSATEGPRKLQLPASDWWNHLRWDVIHEGGEVPPLRAEVMSHDRVAVHSDGTAELQGGQRLVAKVTLGELPAGEYRLTVSLGDLRSEPEWFLVSDGNESPDLRREFARYKVDRSRDKESLRTNLLELAATDPLNASPWIRLGDLALADGTTNEIRSYYDRAVEVLDHRRQKFAAAGRQDVLAAIDREREVILALRDVIPQYVANRATLILHADLRGGRHYVLRDRATNRVLRTIAPRPASSQR